MRQSELKKCALCDKGVMHSNDITFMRVRIDRMVVDLRAVRQQAGLEMMMGSAPLAAVFSPNADIAQQAFSHEFLVCQSCAMEQFSLFEIEERAASKEPAHDSAAEVTA